MTQLPEREKDEKYRRAADQDFVSGDKPHR
jgi:hypothetical protein